MRAAPLEIRTAAGRRLQGYAATFGTVAQIGAFNQLERAHFYGLLQLGAVNHVTDGDFHGLLQISAANGRRR